MRLYLLLLTTGALVIEGALGASEGCNYYQEVAAGLTFQIFSPNYPLKYPRGVDCRWEAVAPANSKLILNCSNFSLPQVSEKQIFVAVHSGRPQVLFEHC